MLHSFEVNLTKDQTDGILQKMNDEGFSSNDYDVFEKSCNTFTEAFSVKLGLIENFPPAVHHQSRLGAMLAPLVRALEIATEKSSFEPNLLQPSTHAPVQASGILSSSFASSYVKKGRGNRVTSVKT